MSLEKSNKGISGYILRIQQFVDRSWYPPFIALLAALDNFIVVIPNDGILISSAIITPRRWFILALNVAIGSTMGALGLAACIELMGLPWILEIYPGVAETKIWAWTVVYFERYGLIILFLIAVTPLMQQPAIILASLANTPLIELAAVIFLGRFIKFLVMAYIASHTPRLINKLWGLKGELTASGVKVK